jgi:glyoxylase I family protein
MDPDMLKMIVCCRDLPASRRFYADVLGLPVVEEWDQEEGKGCIVAVGDAQLELCEVPPSWEGYRPAYDQTVANDKVALQLRTDSVSDWVQRLAGRWEFEPPIDRPWGHRYLYLRDPDGLKVALFEVLRTSP